MKGTIVATAALLLSAPFAASHAPAKQIVEIRVRGHFFSAPATIPVTIAVEPGASNRALVVEADSDDYYRSSMIELDGENEKRLHSLELKNLPAGDYVVRAEVRSKSEILGTAVNELVVTGMTPER